MTAFPAEAAVAKKPRRRWWRFFLQFSLRSLLAVTTLAAVACWWYLQPPTREEELAGKNLKLQRQVRLLPMKQAVRVGPNTFDDEIALLNVGHWRLLDRRGDPLVVGRYHEGQPQGKWTVYHTNGRKAAEGSVLRGGRNGLWRTWDVEGRLLSEATYVAVEKKGLFANAEELARISWDTKRQGPARAWHANGQLKFTGGYANDRRSGKWTEYDEAGRVTAEGQYRHDLKEGKWRERVATNEGLDTREVEYIAGRMRAAHEQLLAALKQDLAGDSLERQVAAVDRLEMLGSHGVPLLLGALDRSSDNLKVVASRALERVVARVEQPASLLLAGDILAKLTPLVDAADARLSRQAIAIVYRLQPAERERLFPRLMTAVRSASDIEWQLQTLKDVLQCDRERRAATFEVLAVVADDRLPPPPVGGTPRDWLDGTDFIQLAQDLDDLPKLLATAAQSQHPAVRRFVLWVIHEESLRGKPVEMTLPGGGRDFQYPIPEPYVDLVKQARSDGDATVRAVAESVGHQPRPPMGGGLLGGRSGGGVF